MAKTKAKNKTKAAPSNKPVASRNVPVNEKGWFNTGYEAARKRAKELEQNSGTRLPWLGLKDGDTRKVRFLTPEPLSFEEHGIRVNGKFRGITCIRGTGQICPLCAEKGPRYVGAYIVFDYDEEDPKRKVKVFKQGIKVVQLLDKLNSRKGGLNGFDVEIMRTGSGPQDTTYNVMPDSPKKFAQKLVVNINDIKAAMLKEYAPRSIDELKELAGNVDAGIEPPAESTDAPDAGDAAAVEDAGDQPQW